MSKVNEEKSLGVVFCAVILTSIAFSYEVLYRKSFKCIITLHQKVPLFHLL